MWSVARQYLLNAFKALYENFSVIPKKSCFFTKLNKKHIDF